MRGWLPVVYGFGFAWMAMASNARAEPLLVSAPIEVEPPIAGAVLNGDQRGPVIASNGTEVLSLWAYHWYPGVQPRVVVAMPLDTQCTPLLDHVVETGWEVEQDTRFVLRWDGDAFVLLQHDSAGDRPGEIHRLDAMAQPLGDASTLAGTMYAGLSCASSSCIAVSSSASAITIERVDSDGGVETVATVAETVASEAIRVAWIDDAHVVLWPRIHPGETHELALVRVSADGELQDDVPITLVSGIDAFDDAVPTVAAGGPAWLVQFGTRLWSIDGVTPTGLSVAMPPFDAGAWLGSRYALVDPHVGASLYTPGATAIDELVPFELSSAYARTELATTSEGVCIRGDEMVGSFAEGDGLGTLRNPMLAYQPQYAPQATHAEAAGLVVWGGPDPLGETIDGRTVRAVDDVGAPTGSTRVLEAHVGGDEYLVSSRTNHAHVRWGDETGAIELLGSDGALQATLDVPDLPALVGRPHRYLAAWGLEDGMGVRVFDLGGATIAEHASHPVSPSQPSHAIAAGDGFVIATQPWTESFFDEVESECSLVFLDADGSLAVESDRFAPCPWGPLMVMASDGEQVLALEAGGDIVAHRFDMTGAPLDEQEIVVMPDVRASGLDATWDGEAVLVTWSQRTEEQLLDVALARVDIDGVPIDDAEPVVFHTAEDPDLSADGRLLVYESRADDRLAPRILLHVLGEPDDGGSDSSGGDTTAADSDSTAAESDSTMASDGGSDGVGADATQDGCGCRQRGDDRGGWWLLALPTLVARRRAR